MSTTTTITTICDAGHCLEVPADVTRTLQVDGRSYEIDLCAPCSVGLDTELAAVLKNARAVTAAKRRKIVARSQEQRDETARVRAWWRDHEDEFDFPCQHRGRIPGVVTTAHDRAEGN